MSVLSRVTAKTLKKNRVRTLVTIIGILLSAAMFTAVATIVTSFYDFTVKGEKSYHGDYHVCIMRCDGAKINDLSADERVYQNSVLEYMGYAGIDSANNKKPYLSVIGANDSFFENMSLKLLQGRLPENDTEILLPETLGYNGRVSLQPGDSLELALGERNFIEEKLYQDTSFCEGESLDLSGGKTAVYTVVGIYKRAYFEIYCPAGYAALTRKNSVTEEGNYQCYFKVKSPSENLDAVLKSHAYSVVFDGDYFEERPYEKNYTLLALDGNLRGNSVLNAFLIIGAVVCVLIFAGSVSLIYNAFAISVSERTKQFGILASVGATKKQLRAGVFYEAFVLALIAVPLGIGLGLLGIGLTLHFLKDVIANTGSHTFGDVELTLSVSPWALLAAAALSFITVLVSAWIPSKRAMRISPIEAIRQNRDLKWAGKSPRSSKLILKLFGTEGMLAKQYYQRSKKKYRATVFSLAMSLVLFIGASAFILYAARSVSIAEIMYGGENYDLCYFYGMSLADFESIRGELESFAEEVCATEFKSSGGFFTADRADMTDDYQEYVIKDIESQTRFNPNVQADYMDDATFERLLQKYEAEKTGGESDEMQTVLIVNPCTRFIMNEEGQFEKIHIFDTLREGTKSIKLAFPKGSNVAYWSGQTFGSGDLMVYSLQGGVETDEQGKPIAKTLELESVYVGAILEEPPLGINRSTDMSLQIIFPLSDNPYETDTVEVYLRCADSREAAKKFQEVLAHHGIAFEPDLLHDSHEEARINDSALLIVKVFTYGFTALITLIAAANAFNTITTNVALRRRDYAMLRSIGMTKRGMNRMMNYECLLYGSRALLYGLPVAIGFTYLMYLAVADLTTLPFELPWTAILIAVVGIFLVVFVSMLYQTGKIKRDNLLETLRNENI